MKTSSRSRATKTKPTHWNDSRLRFLCRFNPSKSEINQLARDALVSFVPMERVSVDGSFDLSESKPIHDVYNGFTYFQNGDVLVAKITPCFENGKGGLASNLRNGIGFGTTEFHVIRPDKIDGPYLEYLCRSHPFRTIGETEMFGAAGQKRVPDSFIKNEVWPLPPREEQAAIADFLDRETARIDSLIAKEERLLELLEEKRRALISNAVTKGIDPGAELVDSGIEWLGKIPKGWSIKKIKHVTRILRRKFAHRPRNAPHLYNGDFPFIQTGDVARATKYIREYTQTLTKEGYFVSKEFPKGTLCMAIAANIGDVAILDFNACFPDSVVGFVPLSGARLEYLYYLFIANRKQFTESSVKNTQANLNIDRIGNMLVAVPPAPVQESIAQYIGENEVRTTSLKTKIHRAIALLRERRTALISAAVTGKIDIPSNKGAPT